MLPFRATSIFRNRWVTLLWAVGICFMASEIVDSVSGVTGKGEDQPAADRSVATAPTRETADGPATGTVPPVPAPVDIAR